MHKHLFNMHFDTSLIFVTPCVATKPPLSFLMRRGDHSDPVSTNNPDDCYAVMQIAMKVAAISSFRLTPYDK